MVWFLLTLTGADSLNTMNDSLRGKANIESRGGLPLFFSAMNMV